MSPRQSRKQPDPALKRGLGLVLILAIAWLGGARLPATNDEERQVFERYGERYFEILEVAHERYGTAVPYEDLIQASLQGMMRGLDPHTTFLPPSAFDTMRERQRATIFGIGILIAMRDGRLTVITPIEGTPAFRAGMQAGDIIDAVEGKPTEEMTLAQAISRIKGPKGTEVRLTLLRRGLDEPLLLNVTRDEIPQTTVRQAYMMTQTTGYLRVTDFSRSTGREVADGLAALRRAGMEQLILDLRNNGGGLLDQAIAVADQFLPEGAGVVDTRGRIRSSYQSFQASGGGPVWNLPLVVLVNRGTASAAEIVSGAIQDHDMGMVVGTTTWGKGLVQTVYNLCNGSGLALTTSRYYTPSGRQIQRDYSSFYDYYAAREPGEGSDEEEDVFFTRLGRKVYGGGGITPDEVVEVDELSSFRQALLIRNAFSKFSIDYQNRNGEQALSWEPGSKVLESFRDWVATEEIILREEVEEELQDAETREWARRQIQAEVMNANFGQEAWHRALARIDPQIQRGLELFPQAAELSAQRSQKSGSGQASGLRAEANLRPESRRETRMSKARDARPGAEARSRNNGHGLLISSLGTRWNTDALQRHDGASGSFVGPIAGPGRARMAGATGLTLGPDGNLYVANMGASAVLRFDGESGEFLDVFVPRGSAGLVAPTDLVFGPEGKLYVAGARGVLVYDGHSGAYLDTIVVRTRGGLSGAHGLAFGPSGNLYVASRGDHAVLRYDRSTGKLLGTFIQPRAGGLDDAYDMVFGPDGNLYITSFCSSKVLRYDGTSGEFLDSFVSGGSGGLVGPTGLAFGPDGHLYVASSTSGGVLRYDGATGSFLGTLVGRSQAPEPFHLIFVP